jgi:hypothetical protein
MSLHRVLRPLLSVLVTAALTAFVIIDRVGDGQRLLGLDPPAWARLVFPVQVTSLAIARAIRARRKRLGLEGAGEVPAKPRFSTLEFAELCAIVLTIGYSFLINRRLDESLAPGWQIVLVAILVAIPLVAKLVTERQDT